MKGNETMLFEGIGRWLAVAALAGLLAVASACGGTEADAASASDEIKTGPGLIFSPDRLSIERDSDVRLTLSNPDPLVHTFTIDELDIDVELAPGEESEITLRVANSGQYQYYCAIPGHREAGQVGTLIVE
jgi:plastocyanin